MSRWVKGGFVLAALAGAAWAQGEPAPDEMTGVKIGETAPDFTLEGHDGRQYTLSEMVKNGPVAVMFYRSAHW
jgi:cytochrome oxidase Cu insertion factor (SCO1/SenC/PrrC family)